MDLLPIVRAFARESAEKRKVALGLNPKAHLPATLDAVVFHNGILLWLEPRMPGDHPKRQRVRAECPVCQRNFAAGNLGQHFNTHIKEA